MEYQSFKAAIEPHIDADYFIEIVFDQAVEIVCGPRSTKKTNRLACRLFRGKKGGIYYITRARSSTGYAIYIQYENVVEINVLPADWRQRRKDGSRINQEIDRIKRAAHLITLIHPNAWSSLREELRISPLTALPNNRTLRTYPIARYLRSDEQEQLRQAFENKTEWRWSRRARGGRGRDLKIETKQCDDGEFMAWYSSEYPGCGNGDYYLLINPTTAVFSERD